MDAGLAPILFVLVVSVTDVQSQIIKGPVDALKIVRDSVTLECVTRNSNCDQVEWVKMEGTHSLLTVYRDGIGMINTDAFPSERYSVNSTGVCSLTIAQLNISDAGKFSCVLRTEFMEEISDFILVVNNPVKNIAVSPSSGPYYVGTTVRCTADGHPYPTFKWTHLKSGTAYDNETLVVTGAAGDKYNCTATNTVKGRAESQSLTIEVSLNSDRSTGTGVGCGQECVAAIVMSISIALMVTFVAGWKLGWWPMRFRFLYNWKEYMESSVGIIISCVIVLAIAGLSVTFIVCRIVPSCPLYDSIKSVRDEKERRQWLREAGRSVKPYGP